MAIIFMSEVGGQVLIPAGEDGTCAKRQNRNIFGNKLTMENILLIFLENCQFLQSKYISSHFLKTFNNSILKSAYSTERVNFLHLFLQKTALGKTSIKKNVFFRALPE